MLYRFPRHPFGPPFLFQPGSSFRPPTGPGGQSGQDLPPGRPPTYTPQEPAASVTAVDPGSIRRCRYKFTYLWLKDRQQYWAYITFVGRRSIAGFRWIGFRWVYFGTDLRNIKSFICY